MHNLFFDLQKPPTEVFYKDRCALKSLKFQRKTPASESSFTKVAGCATLLKKDSSTVVFL